MRVVVVGAEGPVGGALVGHLADDPSITAVVSLVGRPTGGAWEEHLVDVRGDLSSWFAHADAAVYAGWPAGGCGRDWRAPRQLAAVRRTCEAASHAGVRALVVGSTGAVYRAACTGPVDEESPTGPPGRSDIAAPAVAADRIVEDFEDAHPIIRTVRLRSGWVVGSPEPTPAGGPTVGRRVAALLAGRLKVVPDPGSRVVQLLHVADLAEAYRLALLGSVSGAFNVAAEPVDRAALTQEFGGHPVRAGSNRLLKTWAVAGRAGVHHADPDRLRLAMVTPVLDTGRARRQLDWAPRHSSGEVLAEWVAALEPTKRRPLGRQGRPSLGGPGARAQEVAARPPEAVPELVADYEAALTDFGHQVRSLHADQWQVPTGWEGWSVLELVTVAARDQYRIGLLLRGTDPAAAAGGVPGDPLGFVRADGWDLAAERVRLAATGQFGDAGEEGALSAALEHRIVDVLPGALRQLRRWTEALADAVGAVSP